MEEAQAFAQKLEERTKAGDEKYFLDSFDTDAMLDVSLADQDLNSAVVKKYRADVADSLREWLPTSIGGGSYKFMRINTLDQKTRALFRVVRADGGLNYHELMLRRSAGRGVEIVDIYSFLAGELMSVTFHRGFMNFLAARPGPANQPAPQKNPWVENMRNISQMQMDFQVGRTKEGLAIFSALPDEVRRDKSLQILRLQALGSASDEDCAKVMDEYLALFPGDPSLYLVKLSAFMARSQFGKAIEAMQQVERTVGGDPYLQYLEGTAHFGAHEKSEAKACAETAIEKEPTLAGPYDLLVTISLDERDFNTTARILAMTENNLSIQLPDLTQVPEFKDFVQSDAYKKWMESRKK